MCGRFTLRTPPEPLQAHFGLAERPGLVPRYNIAPGQPVAVVRVGVVELEVLAPEALRAEFAAIAARMHNRYNAG